MRGSVVAERRSAGDGPRDEAARLKAEADRLDDQARRLREEAKWWDIGGDGEEIVGGVLDAGLSEDGGWHVIHSVVISSGGGDIDHVVVGTPGVFTLNTKHHQEKTVWVSGDVYDVDGRPRPYLSAAMSEAEKATRRLSAACSFNVRVHPVIVVVGSADLQIPQQPPDVRVVSCDDVVEWLQSLPPVLSRHEAAAIAERAGDPATWFPPSTLGRRRTKARIFSRSRPGPRRTKARRRSGLAEVVVALGVIIAAFVLLSRLSHHPVSDPASSTGATPAASSVTPTTASPNFQAVGTVTNGQCVDVWSNHDVEVLISGAQAGSDCTRFAAPSYTATLAPGGFLTPLSGPYGRSTSGIGLEQVCSGALSDGDHITVYDEGEAAFGHSFCTSAGVPQ
jgi:hypothetical protein